MKKQYRIFIGLLISSIGLILLATSCQTKIVDNTSQFLSRYVNENKTLIVAHRGYSEIAPENTISAFKAASNVGAKTCEFDVQISKDGVLVVIHDNTVDRTTNGSGKVEQLRYEDLSSLDAGSWKDLKYKGEKIPTLLETLTFLEKNNMIAVLEIKADNITDEVLKLVYETGMEERIIIISFSKSTISDVMKKDPKIPALLLLKKNSCMTGSTNDKVKGIEREAKRIGTTYIGPYSFQLEKMDSTLSAIAKYDMKKSRDPGVLPLALDKETIEKLHENGYFINTWTVDNEENIRDLIINKVDMLTTNSLEKALSIKNEIYKND